MIENVTKSVRRKEVINEEYMAKLFASMTDLYRLNEGQGVGAGVKSDLGPMPQESVVLLIILGVTWTGLFLYIIAEKVLKRKNIRK